MEHLKKLPGITCMAGCCDVFECTPAEGLPSIRIEVSKETQKKHPLIQFVPFFCDNLGRMSRNFPCKNTGTHCPVVID